MPRTRNAPPGAVARDAGPVAAGRRARPLWPKACARSRRNPIRSGGVLAEWDRPSGLHIQRVATPLGVIGVIYESRPNVTADAAGLALKAGNAVILRGVGKPAEFDRDPCRAGQGLVAAGLPEAAVQMGATATASGALMLRAQGLIDVIVPRGGKALSALSSKRRACRSLPISKASATSMPMAR